MAPSYRELPPPPGLDTHVACVWTSHDRAARVESANSVRRQADVGIERRDCNGG